jgi:hypothetical protein
MNDARKAAGSFLIQSCCITKHILSHTLKLSDNMSNKRPQDCQQFLLL